MTIESARLSTRTSVAQAERTPFSRRLFKLEHPSNVGPLVHIGLWLAVLAVGLLAPGHSTRRGA